MADNRKSTLKSLSTYVKEHFTKAAYGVYPIEDDSKIAIVIVSNKYSPNNFWSVLYRIPYPAANKCKLVTHCLQERTVAISLHLRPIL